MKKIILIINRIGEDRYTLENLGESYYLNTNFTRKEVMKKITKMLPKVSKLLKE